MLIFVHKEECLDDVERLSVRGTTSSSMGKLRIVKRFWGYRVTTVFPRQGHYAFDPEILAAYQPADITIERIGDLINYDQATLI